MGDLEDRAQRVALGADVLVEVEPVGLVVYLAAAIRWTGVSKLLLRCVVGL